MKKRLEAALGRSLDPEELRLIVWLEDWEYDTRIAAEGLFMAMFRAGQMDVMLAAEEVFAEKKEGKR